MGQATEEETDLLHQPVHLPGPEQVHQTDPRPEQVHPRDPLPEPEHQHGHQPERGGQVHLHVHQLLIIPQQIDQQHPTSLLHQTGLPVQWEAEVVP